MDHNLINNLKESYAGPSRVMLDMILKFNFLYKGNLTLPLHTQKKEKTYKESVTWHNHIIDLSKPPTVLFFFFFNRRVEKK